MAGGRGGGGSAGGRGVGEGLVLPWLWLKKWNPFLGCLDGNKDQNLRNPALKF